MYKFNSLIINKINMTQKAIYNTRPTKTGINYVVQQLLKKKQEAVKRKIEGRPVGVLKKETYWNRDELKWDERIVASTDMMYIEDETSSCLESDTYWDRDTLSWKTRVVRLEE